MREITGREIAARIDIAAILPAMREALRADVEGPVEVPLRAGWQFGNGAFGMLAMPARSAALSFAVFKMLTLVDGNRALGIPGVMGELTLLDAVTGEAKARLPAEEVTLLRTAACSAVATDLLAPQGRRQPGAVRLRPPGRASRRGHAGSEAHQARDDLRPR